MTKKKTQQELLAEVNKNEQLKNPVTDYNKAMNDFKNSLQAPLDYKRQLRVAKEQKKQALHAEQDALSQQDWKKVLEAADKLLHSGQMGYDSWVSAMSSVVQTSADRNKALLSLSTLRIVTNDVPSLLLDLSIILTSGAVTALGAPINLGAKMIGYDGVDWRDLQPNIEAGLKGLVGLFTTMGEDTLPGVRYFVEFDAEHKLVIKDLMLKNGKNTLNPFNGNIEPDLDRTQCQAYQAMVVAFLAENYKCVADPSNPGRFKNEDARLLEQDVLNRYLNDDPTNCLKDYLQSKLGGIDIAPLPSPRP